MSSPNDRERRVALLSAAFADFATFCGLLQIVPKTGVRQRFKLNAIQRAYVAKRTPRDIVLKPRQIGFTTLEQARDVFIFLTRPGARVVTTCQSIQDETPIRMLSANYRLMFESLRNAGVRIDFAVEYQAEWVLAGRDSSLRIMQAGASQEAATKKGRAGTITRLHLTETAFYEYAAETLNALFECVPTVEHDTEIVNESTPNGAAGVYYEQYQSALQGTNGYQAHFFPWFMQEEYKAPLAPGELVVARTEREFELIERYDITPEQLKWYRQKVELKGQALTDQEYPTDPVTCFLVSGRKFFDVTVTQTLLARATSPIRTESITAGCHLHLWALPESQMTYVIAVDPSEGTGGDPGAAVLYRRNGDHIGTLHGQLSTWDMARAVAALGRRFNNALLVVERNNHGHAVLQALSQQERYERIYIGEDGKPGWAMSPVTRSMALDALEDAHRLGAWTSPDRNVLSEFLRFIVNKNGRPEAAAGAHDDLVMATAMAWHVLSRPANVTRLILPRNPPQSFRIIGRGY